MEIAVLGSVTRNRYGILCLPYAAVNQHDVALLSSDLEGATLVESGVAYRTYFIVLVNEAIRSGCTAG